MTLLRLAGAGPVAPNATHLALARLERLGKVGALVTQNIDGLHLAAGSSSAKVIEMHGTNRWVECIECGKLADPDEPVAAFQAERRTPACECGGWLKFATISFGQALKPEVLARAAREAAQADAALSLGSTLSVRPAADIRLVVARRQLPYAVINRAKPVTTTSQPCAPKAMSATSCQRPWRPWNIGGRQEHDPPRGCLHVCRISCVPRILWHAGSPKSLSRPWQR